MVKKAGRHCLSWPPGGVLFSWDASSSPTLKAGMHETETGLPCQRGVCFGRNSPGISMQEGDSGAAQPGLLHGAWKAADRSFRPGVCAQGPGSTPKNPQRRWAKFKAPCGLLMFSIHAAMLDSISSKVDHVQVHRDCAKGSVPMPCTSPATRSALATTPLPLQRPTRPWLCLIK